MTVHELHGGQISYFPKRKLVMGFMSCMSYMDGPNQFSLRGEYLCYFSVFSNNNGLHSFSLEWPLAVFAVSSPSPSPSPSPSSPSLRSL